MIFEDAADLLGLLAELDHVSHDDVYLAFDGAHRFLRSDDGLVARAGGRGRIRRDPGDALGALGDLPRRRQQLADGRRDLVHGRRLFLGARDLLIGRRLQLGGRALHVLHRRADLARQRANDQEAGARDDEEAEQRPQKNRGLGAGGGGFHLVGALLEQVALFLLHLGQHAAKSVHRLLALARLNELRRRLEPGRLAQVDCSSHLLQFRRDQGVRLVEPLLLIGIVGRQLSQILLDRGDPSTGLAIRLKEGIVAGDDVTPLSGLCVLEQAEQVGNVFQDHVGVAHQVAGLRQRVDAPVRHPPNQQQQNERQRESARNLLSKRPHVRSP